jgi:hypothetical protein
MSIGPYALLMQEKEIQSLRDKFQQNLELVNDSERSK